MNNKGSFIRTIITYLLIIGVALYLISMLTSTATKDMTYTELIQKIEDGKVAVITLDNSRYQAKVKLKDE